MVFVGPDHRDVHGRHAQDPGAETRGADQIQEIAAKKRKKSRLLIKILTILC